MLKKAGWRRILTADHRGSMPIRGCTSDNGVHVYRNVISICPTALPYVAGCLAVAPRPPERRCRSKACGKAIETLSKTVSPGSPGVAGATAIGLQPCSAISDNLTGGRSGVASRDRVVYLERLIVLLRARALRREQVGSATGLRIPSAARPRGLGSSLELARGPLMRSSGFPFRKRDLMR